MKKVFTAIGFLLLVLCLPFRSLAETWDGWEREETSSFWQDDPAIPEFDNQALISALQRHNSAGLRKEEKACYVVLHQAVSGFSAENEYETERSIWKFMQDNYTYMHQTERDEDNTPYGLAVNQKGTAEAYAKTFYVLAKTMGLETYYIEGTLSETGEAWAWNKVRLDGQWYNIDTAMNGKSQTLDYVNLTDSQISETHRWQTESYPVCSATQYHYANAQILEYLKNGRICSSQREARDYIEERIAASAKKFYVLSETDLTDTAKEYGNVFHTQISLLDGAVYHVIALSPTYY